ncbi:MAG: response regulator [Clostridiaceae bacterium]|nr:response regulator [Clostridiaceae bacterium]
MIKVLIADDEIIARAGIKSLVNWEENGFRVVGLAADGKEAMEMIRSERPDIVLTDIMMPKLSGIELIKNAKAEYPFIKFIVLSCHNEFEYVRQAMKFGAEDYVLKLSMVSGELLELLLSVSEKIKEERKLDGAELRIDDAITERSKRIEYLISLINGEKYTGELKDHESVRLFDVSAPKALAYVKIDNFENIGEDSLKAERTLVNVMEQQLKDRGLLELFRYKENGFVFLLSFDIEKFNDIEKTVYEISQKLSIFINKYVNVSVSIGISSIFKDYSELNIAFSQAVKACKSRFYKGAGTVCKYHDKLFTEESIQVFTVKEQKDLIDYLDICDIESIRKLINNIIDALYRTCPPVEKCIQLFMEVYYCMSSVLKNYGDSIGDESDKKPDYIQISNAEFLKEAGDMLMQYGEYCVSLIEKARHSAYRKEIIAAIDYIKKNYSSDISLKSVAQHVFVSDSYLSRIFKEDMNKSFVEYLTEIRIEKAIELIKTTDLPNYVIAEKIGYENINYFGRVFKKITGLTPSQYRNRYSSFNTGKKSE